MGHTLCGSWQVAPPVHCSVAMASAWASTSYTKYEDFTYTWDIRQFDKVLKLERRGGQGELRSPLFSIPGIPWKVSLCVKQDDVDGSYTDTDRGTFGMPDYVMHRNWEHLAWEDIPITQYFKIYLREEWREQWESTPDNQDHFEVPPPELMAAEVRITALENNFIMTGKLGDPKKYEFKKNTENWIFESDIEAEVIYTDHCVTRLPIEAKHFYTMKATNSLTIEATFSVQGELKTVSGEPEAKVNENEFGQVWSSLV